MKSDSEVSKGNYLALAAEPAKSEKRGVDTEARHGGPVTAAIVSVFTPARIIWMFVIINLLNYVDRGIIPGAPVQFQSFIHETLQVPHSVESTYLGILQSVFIATFSVAVVAAGNLVHKYPPFVVMGAGLAIWCVAVFLSGLAKPLGSFAVLISARALSGVGEASFQCIAPAFIEDFAPSGQKVLWLGVFFSSITVGTAGGYAFSAVVSTSSWGWAWAFWMEGLAMIPFVLIALILPYKLSGKENGVSIFKEVHTILYNQLFINISLGYAAYCAVLAGLSTFGPQFFQGLQLFDSEKSASLHFSGIVALAGAVGTPFGGWVSDRYAGSNASRREVLDTCLRIMSVSSALGMVCAIAAAYCTTRTSFLVLMGAAVMLLFLPTGCCTMAVMAAVPSHMRASAVALNILIMHVLGDVPSPIAVGALKDWLAPRCNTKTVDGVEVLNPDCILDGPGLRLTLVLCLSLLGFTVLFWTIPLLFPLTCGKPAVDEDENDAEAALGAALLKKRQDEEMKKEASVKDFSASNNMQRLQLRGAAATP
eukprot:CAMPEP_0167790454 /NCGR_PEP_ID=MMETSP0111_2-20121227/11328_1 /TAXON_ID=91324 /ORGANISM="Lotharella globosa, Strain CCCM811" /LENGTH=536 /DNA_ID=CAMNT_0007682891 /DNA_START=94 /DNA_END=1701 /DNA_ORIENTATION=-